MAQTVWELALATLEKVHKGMPVQVALAGNYGKLSDQDLRLCGDLVNGCLRSFLRISHILGKVLRRPARLPEKMRMAMMLGVYSILGQAHVPDYASVDNTVNLVKKGYGAKLAGVANGALRSILRLEDLINDPLWYKKGPSSKTFDAYALYYSIPADIAALWLHGYGEEAALSIMRRSAERPWSGVRINLANPQAGHLLDSFTNLGEKGAEHIGEAGFAFAPGSLPQVVEGRTLWDWHSLGALSFQSPGSMLILEELGIMAWQEDVWDACAGFGGKSAAMLERNVPVKLVSDVDAKRLAGMRRDMARLKTGDPGMARSDILRPPLKMWHGNILLDVPCSGLGVLARRPDIRLRRKTAHIDGLRKLQMEMLKRAAHLLKKGREMAYMTCTINPAENEEVIASFLRDSPDFFLKTTWHTSHGHPWLEGMYGAVLSRN